MKSLFATDFFDRYQNDVKLIAFNYFPFCKDENVIISKLDGLVFQDGEQVIDFEIVPKSEIQNEITQIFKNSYNPTKSMITDEIIVEYLIEKIFWKRKPEDNAAIQRLCNLLDMKVHKILKN